MNSSRDSVYLIQEEGNGGSSILGVFTTLQKAESFRKKFKEIYICQISILLQTSGILGLQKQDGHGMSLIFNNLEQALRDLNHIFCPDSFTIPLIMIGIFTKLG